MNSIFRQKGLGSLIRELIVFSIPLILSGVLQQLYSWADALIVGNVEGELALGAIGGTGSVSGFFVLMITGFTVGTGVLAAQQYGAGKIEDVRDVLGSFTLILGGAFLALSAVGFFTIPAMLRLLDTPADTFGMADEYLRIIFLGIPFLAVYNVFAAVVRAVGDSKAPFYSILVSSGINILLDLLLVLVLRMGIRGAALATVLSQFLMTAFLVVYTVKKHPEIVPKLSGSMFRGDVIRRGFTLGIPPMLQSCITSGGNLILQNFMNSFGTATVIAITSAYRIDTLTLLPVINTTSAISTFAAQSYGAGDRDRLERIRKAGILVMVVESLLLTGIVVPFGSRLIALFGAGEEAVRIGHDFFIRLASFYVPFGFYNAIRGYLEGIGDVTFASILSVVMLGIRIICSYVFAPLWGNMVIAYAEAIAWVCACVMFVWRQRSIQRRM